MKYFRTFAAVILVSILNSHSLFAQGTGSEWTPLTSKAQDNPKTTSQLGRKSDSSLSVLGNKTDEPYGNWFLHSSKEEVKNIPVDMDFYISFAKERGALTVYCKSLNQTKKAEVEFPLEIKGNNITVLKDGANKSYIEVPGTKDKIACSASISQISWKFERKGDVLNMQNDDGSKFQLKKVNVP